MIARHRRERVDPRLRREEQVVARREPDEFVGTFVRDDEQVPHAPARHALTRDVHRRRRRDGQQIARHPEARVHGIPSGR
jgi:hypothetical protein